MSKTPPHASRDAALGLLSGHSLEMTGKDLAGLQSARGLIPPGTRINITFLGNEDLGMRVAAAEAVRRHGFIPVPHVSARRLASAAELEGFLARLAEVGAAEHVCVVGGDPAAPEGPYADALSVIRSGLLEKFGVREVSLGGYPEGHPDIDGAVLAAALDAKTAALREQGIAPAILTQFSFDAQAVAAWIAAVRGQGVDAPIRVGVPGPAGITRLLAFARRFGIGANAMIVRKYGFSLTQLAGNAGPERFITDLAGALALSPRELGPVGLHFYTFGGLAATAGWIRGFAAEEA